MTTPVVVTIDATGISAVPFELVLEYFQSQFRTIYGADIVIDPDTQDGELLGIYAQALDDTNNAAITAFNSFRPGFAVGAGLSSIVKINGLTRKIATNSQVIVTVGGTVGTTLFQVYVRDNLNLNTEWFIAGPLVIPPAGVINTTAYCTTQGAINAGIGAITEIVTPVPGWQTVYNPAAATPGLPIETDAQLRRRQTKSTANPAKTVRSSIEGNLLAVPTVERARVYENDQFYADPVTGIPASCIAAVVKGSDTVAIANSIAMTKPPGIPTYGNVTQTILDQEGTPATINYWELIEIQIYALIQIKAVVGYSDAIGTMVQQSVVNWVNNLDIGVSLHLGDVYSPANLDGDAATEATGRTQSALDPMGATYSIIAPHGLALARQDMNVVGGPYTGNAVNVANANFFHVGEEVWLTLNNGTHQQTKITSISGSALFFADNITSTQTVNAGSLIYAVGDIPMDFYGAATMSHVNNIELMVS